MRVLGRVLLLLELPQAAFGLTPADRSARPDKDGHLRASAAAGHLAESFMEPTGLNHHVRICNAYQSEDALDVYFAPRVVHAGAATKNNVTHPEQMVSAAPLSYKTCKRFKMHLQKNDHIVFKSGNSTVGTYEIDETPVNGTVHGLVIFRHSSRDESRFEHNAFSGEEQPQIWVINAYDGAAEANLHLAEHWKHITWQNGRQTIGYNSMVSITRGKYEAVLVNPDGDDLTSATLVALPREGYIVMRVGMETEKKSANEVVPYPQELVVFPSGSLGLHAGLGSLLLCALVFANLY
jgi:hypothetical protein